MLHLGCSSRPLFLLEHPVHAYCGHSWTLCHLSLALSMKLSVACLPLSRTPTSIYSIYHLIFVTDTDMRLAVVFIICRMGRGPCVGVPDCTLSRRSV
ncbi:hypothetical protein BD309DRAFT_955949 [Dichomitus squalens]|nr:hypothetical protein BD309DRAFT_955949 [Dichomitus squalens]